MTASDSAGPDDERLHLLATAAELYYLHGLDQNSISREIGMSRSNVSRLLSEARLRGVIEVRIHYPLARASSLESELVSIFGLADARVLAARPGVSVKDALRPVGRLAADYLLENLRDGLVIGLSWGTSLEAMVEAVMASRSYAVEVVQLLGGLSWVSPSLSGHELGRRLADKLGGTFSYLHAPAIVDSAAAAESLRRQPGIADVLARGEKADIAFVGVGSFGTGSSKALFSRSYLTPLERREIKASGAVGDVCARVFTEEGEECGAAVGNRVIGVDLDSLRKIPRVVAVARGLEKVQGILGALRGGSASVLITDELTASEVVHLQRQRS